MAIPATIISQLGSSSSLIPIALKDGVDTTSLIYHSYKKGGKEEGIDRAVDEIGMQVIWIAGIPIFKKISDWTAYKIAKISPKVDTRLLYGDNGDYINWALENAKGSVSKKTTVKEALEAGVQNPKLTKNLFAGKIAVSTALTLAACVGLTQAKQRLTKKNVEDSVKKQTAAKTFLRPDVPGAFKGVTFTGLGANIAKDIAFNPVHNTWVIDGGITTQRLAQSRNKTELAEHAIKEGVFLFTIYGLGEVLKKAMNNFSNKILGIPINMEIQVLQSDTLKNGIETAADDVLQYRNAAGVSEKFEKGLFDFLVKNPDNLVVDAAKNSGIISTVEHNGKKVINTSKYIDVTELNTLAHHIKNFAAKANASGDTDKFIKKAKALKVGSVLTNIAIACTMLGFVVPKLVYKFRQDKTGTCDFHVAKDIKDHMKNKKAQG